MLYNAIEQVLKWNFKDEISLFKKNMFRGYN